MPSFSRGLPPVDWCSMTETGMNEMQAGAEESHILLQPTNVDNIEAGSQSIADSKYLIDS